MLTENERTIAFYDLRIVLSHSGAADDPALLGQLLKEIADRASRYQAYLAEGTDSSSRLSVRQVKLEKDFAVLLISSSDRTLSNPVFENQVNGKLRIAKKQPPEGIGTAAHLVIFTRDQRRVGRRRKGYLCAIECVEGVGKGRIKRLVDEVLRHAPVSYDVGEERITEPAKFDFHAHADNSLKSQLANGGALDELLLVREEPPSYGIDPPDGVVLVENAVRLKIARGTSKEKVQGFVRGLFKNNQGEFEYVKVRYHTPNGRRTLNIRSEERANFLEQMMAENVDIKVSSPLHQCHEAVVDELALQMRREIEKRV